MRSRTAWMLSVSLLVWGMIGCGEMSQLVARKPKAADILATADEDYRPGAYVQAIDGYERYLEKFPDDPNISMARVRIGTAQLWQLVDTRDKCPALKAAGEILPRIEKERAFADARPEFASILPEIAHGFASQAKAEEDIEKAQKLLDLADKSMELVNNPSYIPTSLRKAIESKLNRIREDMQLAERNINRAKRLDEAVDAIRSDAAAGRTAEASEKRIELLAEYTELERNPRLLETVVSKPNVTGQEKGGAGRAGQAGDILLFCNSFVLSPRPEKVECPLSSPLSSPPFLLRVNSPSTSSHCSDCPDPSNGRLA